MRIAFDGKRYFQNPTGLGNYSRWLMNILRDNHPELELLLYSPREAQSDLTVFSPQTTLAKQFPSFWRSKWITKDLEENKIDIFHGVSNELPFGIHKASIKTVVTIHDLIQKRYPENYTRIDRFIYNKKVDYAQKYADIIIVPSEQTKLDLMRYYNTPDERIKVVTIGKQPIPDYSHDHLIGSPYILCVSGFNERKNLVRLVRAFKKSNLPEYVKLVIAGKKGDSYNRVRKLADSEPSVILMTDVSVSTIHQLYHHAEFCVYPSLFEGFGLPILEAFQHGKTIATSRSSSLTEVGGDAAAYFDPLDTADITRCLENIFHSAMHRSQLTSLIDKELVRFDNTSIAKQYIELYSSLLDT